MRLRTRVLLALVAAAILIPLFYLYWIGAIPYEYIGFTTWLLIALAMVIFIINELIKLIEKVRKRQKAEAVSGTM